MLNVEVSCFCTCKTYHVPERAGVLNVPRVVFTTAGLSRAPKGRQEGPPARVPACGEQRARRWPRRVSGCLWSGRQRRPCPAEQAGRRPRSSVSPRRPLAVSHLHPRGGPGGEEPLSAVLTSLAGGPPGGSVQVLTPPVIVIVPNKDVPTQH